MVKSRQVAHSPLALDAMKNVGADLKQLVPDDLHSTIDNCLTKYEQHSDGQSAAESLKNGVWQMTFVANMSADPGLLLAALIAPGVSAQIMTMDDMEALVGETHAQSLSALLPALQHMSLIDIDIFSHDRGARNIQAMRKMLLAMVQDVRVVILKLVERLNHMNHLDSLSDKDSLAVATAVMDLYAPLANRLGLWLFKWPLEDLAFRYTHPEIYQNIAEQLAISRREREQHVQAMLDILNACIKNMGLEHVEVQGRAKHIYSIYRKMQKKKLSFNQVEDTLAMRVLVDNITDCYKVLSEIHANWPAKTTSFDDYIAMPKPNGYQSLHTVIMVDVMGLVEVQIRTHSMHQQAELGVASHWQYKEGAGTSDPWSSKVALLRELMAWQKELSKSSEHLSKTYQSIFADRVYAFTPNYDIMDLPRGATPLDLAYEVHTQVGHTCRGAKVNGKMMPLHTPLKTGDMVQVLTHKQGKPSRDWLNKSPVIVVTNKAKRKIAQWFRSESLVEYRQQGKQMLFKELKRSGLSQTQWQKFFPELGYKHQADLFAALGRGEAAVGSVMSAARSYFTGGDGRQPIFSLPQNAQSHEQTSQVRLKIDGGSMLSYRAGCCLPMRGDKVMGMLTASRGLSVHRIDCVNLQYLSHRYPEKMIDIEWERDIQTS